MKFKHSPERDEQIFNLIERAHSAPLRLGRLDVEDITIMELLAIARKWRAKALMREARVKEVQESLKECIKENQIDEVL